MQRKRRQGGQFWWASINTRVENGEILVLHEGEVWEERYDIFEEFVDPSCGFRELVCCGHGGAEVTSREIQPLDVDTESGEGRNRGHELAGPVTFDSNASKEMDTGSSYPGTAHKCAYTQSLVTCPITVGDLIEPIILVNEADYLLTYFCGESLRMSAQECP